MAEPAFGKYKSRRNTVEPMQTNAGRLVIKTFPEEGALQKELQIYRLLQGTDLPCAEVIRFDSKALALTELPGQTLVECLAQQEQAGKPQWDMWEKLVAWLMAFQRRTGFVMTDVNLRNFLYDEKTGILYGLDFEECAEGSMGACAAQLAAFIRLYQPENTPVKQQISHYVLEAFSQNLKMEMKQLILESARWEAKLLQRRKNHK